MVAPVVVAAFLARWGPMEEMAVQETRVLGEITGPRLRPMERSNRDNGHRSFPPMGAQEGMDPVAAVAVAEPVKEVRMSTKVGVMVPAVAAAVVREVQEVPVAAVASGRLPCS